MAKTILSVFVVLLAFILGCLLGLHWPHAKPQTVESKPRTEASQVVLFQVVLPSLTFSPVTPVPPTEEDDELKKIFQDKEFKNIYDNFMKPDMFQKK